MKLRRVIGVIVLCSMLISIISMPNIQVQAASFNDINASNVFLKQPVGSVTCTLVANAMMLRRTAMLRGDSDWASITANSMESTAWIEGSGLRRNYTYKSITVSHAYFNAGDKEQQLKDILAQHPEGIVLYDENMPHAVLVTDYTDGAFYYADPSPYEGNGRMKMTSGASVTVSSAERYWYVTSPKVYVDNTIAATSVSINKTSATLTSKGATVSLTATVSPSNATNKSVTWKSSNTSVATVDSNGKVTAVGNGTATITVTTNSGGKTATCNVTVAIPTLNSDGWYYTTVLPSDVTSTKYDIQYQNVYEKYATSSPGTGWKDTGVDKKEYTKSGSAYEADWPLQTSDTVQLVEYYYYHYCGPNTAWNDVNYYARDGYVHRDEMHLNKFNVYEYASGADGENSRITWYHLKWNDANGYDAYCHRYSSDGTCDGSGGEHGERSPYWYKKYVYQNYTVQLLNQYQKTSNWGTTKDSSAVAVNIRYRLKPTSVSLNKTTATLTSKGATVALTATIAPTDAGCKNVTWKSSNTAVATVSSSGVVTAVGNGTATITVSTESGGKTATCKVTVSIVPTGVSLNKSSIVLTAEGQTETLTATVSPSNAADKSVVWGSSNTNVATVDSNGKVTAVGNGIATITVMTSSGSKTATCDVVVRIAVEALRIDKTSITLEKKGDTTTLNASVFPYNALNQKLTWSSSNTAVATVDGDGKVTAVGYGNAVITAMTTDGTNIKATCEVIVKKQYKDGLNLYTDGNLYYFKDNEIDTSYNGVADYDNETWYVANGKVDISKSGVLCRGDWYYFKNGKVQKVTTVARNSSGWWYIKDGKVDFEYDGVGTNGSGTWYIENGKVDFDKTGVLERAGKWYYFNGGKVQRVTTVASNKSGWWYVENGEVNFEYDGVGTNGSGTWYIENGKVDFDKTGFYTRAGELYCFKGGKVDATMNGLASISGKWYLFKNGKVNKITTVANNKYGWWYVENGEVNFEYDGVGTNGSGTWYIENGKVDFDKTGVLERAGKWYYFNGGKVQRVTTVASNKSGWWYVENGEVNFEYDGVGTNASGTWYIENGKVNFDYSGRYIDSNGNVYNIKNGHATLV